VTRLAEIDVTDELLSRARAGEERAREAIYLATAPATLNLIRRLVGQRALAEDLFQDTMMMLFERLPQFRHEAPLGAWLRRVAVSRCLMCLRSPWMRLRLSLAPASPASCAQAPALVTPACRGETVDLERALAALPATARAVVWMYEVEGYSHQEIAREFGRTVSFSKSQLARAHARLREWLEPQEHRQSCPLI
jgi:DNA-directed RNA polymerase specialized sigma24 family protein